MTNVIVVIFKNNQRNPKKNNNTFVQKIFIIVNKNKNQIFKNELIMM